MKRILKLVAIYFVFCANFAFGNTIDFRDISYSALFEVAQKEQKAVLLYFHFDGCAACRKMENTAFIDKNVAEFYNENFICLDVNTRKGEGIETNKIYNVKLHPSFIYLNKEGNVLHEIKGVYSPEEFLIQAKNAIDPKQNLMAYKEQYNQGNREANFLYEYCMKLRNCYELDSTLINEYLNTQSVEDLSKERNIRFIYEFVLHNLETTVPFESDAVQFLLEHKSLFNNYFEQDQVDSRIIWILSNTIDQAIAQQNEELFNKAIEMISNYDDEKVYAYKKIDGKTSGVMTINNIVLTSKMAYYKKSGDRDKYREYQKQYVSVIWDDDQALNSLAMNYYKKYDDSEQLELAKTCAERAVELESSYSNSLTYAALLYKLGEYHLALEQAEATLSIAQKEDREDTAVSTLMKKINEKANQLDR
ncbi:MAG: hypothetical protein CL843_07315 [Crocinitomicaceae bacterium]|nr:hypothetical protein [Crocinitomicaceae bacterium]|tara:strand:- start:7702 stop:8961 length:1260 start_codon:yes stop_codon:yes gene_type:complete